MATKKIEQVLKDTKISEIVSPKLVQAPPETSIKDAIKLMQEKASGYVVVSKKKKVIGVFTEKEVNQVILADGISWSRTIGEFVNPDPKVLCITDSVGQAIDTMGQNKVYHLPVVDEKNDLVNVISVRTLIRFLAGFYPNEVYNLPPRSDQISTSPEGG